MAATDILGKIGEKVGTEINGLSTDIATNATNIATNATNIATNASDIATNASAIATNATDIATNASNISTNATNISNNATAIATNATDIATNASDISALQTRTASIAADGNSASFSGDLSAQNLTLGGNLTVNGTTTSLNTQTLEVEDNIIEVNLVPTTGAETAQTGGLQVNRGKDGVGNVLDKALFVWDDTNDLFSLKKGAIDAKLNVGDVDAEKLIVPNGSAILINNVSLGNYASFETEFLANL
jgi:hypothetical protein